MLGLSPGLGAPGACIGDGAAEVAAAPFRPDPTSNAASGHSGGDGVRPAGLTTMPSGATSTVPTIGTEHSSDATTSGATTSIRPAAATDEEEGIRGQHMEFLLAAAAGARSTEAQPAKSGVADATEGEDSSAFDASQYKVEELQKLGLVPKGYQFPLNYRVPLDRSTKQGHWTAKEHRAFLEGISEYGRVWTKVAQTVGTRTPSQVRSHAQKFDLRIAKKLSESGRLPSYSSSAFATEQLRRPCTSPAL